MVSKFVVTMYATQFKKFRVLVFQIGTNPDGSIIEHKGQIHCYLDDPGPPQGFHNLVEAQVFAQKCQGVPYNPKGLHWDKRTPVPLTYWFPKEELAALVATA